MAKAVTLNSLGMPKIWSPSTVAPSKAPSMYLARSSSIDANPIATGSTGCTSPRGM